MYKEASFSTSIIKTFYFAVIIIYCPTVERAKYTATLPEEHRKKERNSISRHTELHFELRKCAKGTAGNLVAFHNEVINVLQSLLIFYINVVIYQAIL